MPWKVLKAGDLIAFINFKSAFSVSAYCQNEALNELIRLRNYKTDTFLQHSGGK